MQRAERLRLAREQAGYPTAEAAAEAIGVSKPTYHHHENGTRGFARHADRYARFFRVRIAWLMTGEPPIRAMDAAAAVEVFGYVGAGAAVTIEEEARLTGDLAAAWAAIPNGAAAQAFVVRGDSQWPRFLDGEVLIVAREPSKPDELVGQYCMVQIDRGADAGAKLIKILRRGSTPDRWRLESHNAPPLDGVEIRAAWRFLGLLPGADGPHAPPKLRRPAGRAR